MVLYYFYIVLYFIRPKSMWLLARLCMGGEVKPRHEKSRSTQYGTKPDPHRELDTPPPPTDKS